MLRNKGFLDDHLIPIYQKYLPQMRNAHLAINSNKKSVYPMMIKPKLWEQTRGAYPERLFVTIIQLDAPKKAGRDCQPLAMLTRTRLPNFPPIRLHIEIGKTAEVLSSSLSRCITINPKQVSELTDFTLRIYKDVYGKEFEHNERGITYWLAPVLMKNREYFTTVPIPERIIDWNLVQYVSNNPDGLRWSTDTPKDQLLNRYLTDPWDGGRKFYSVAIEENLQAQDPVPQDATPSKNTKFGDTILEYSISLTRESRKRHAARWSLEQPVIRAEKVLHRLNLLDEHSEKEKNVNTKAYVCPQPLNISAVRFRVSL